mmetsp:Transcript_28594/g.91145  ORF Transcript_28594/g.91145 Transcript_28594/m.91145 type:complete len:269 (-) Transcript_28594:757-1563(-)
MVELPRESCGLYRGRHVLQQGVRAAHAQHCQGLEVCVVRALRKYSGLLHCPVGTLVVILEDQCAREELHAVEGLLLVPLHVLHDVHGVPGRFCRTLVVVRVQMHRADQLVCARSPAHIIHVLCDCDALVRCLQSLRVVLHCVVGGDQVLCGPEVVLQLVPPLGPLHCLLGLLQGVGPIAVPDKARDYQAPGNELARSGTDVLKDGPGLPGRREAGRDVIPFVEVPFGPGVQCATLQLPQALAAPDFHRARLAPEAILDTAAVDLRGTQ